MCGILGQVARSAPLEPRRFADALDSIAHRGPDDAGVHTAGPVALGHRRLSIIDLTALGHQPMFSADRSSALIFNGEIYNYIELREELVREGASFTGNSDSEVLLAILDRWGAAGLRRLNGMWAFAYWNERRRTMLICRDRFGKKPLYYLQDDKSFSFSSEPKALLTLRPDARRVDGNTLRRFLAEGRLADTDRSFYADIRSLPAAHFAEFDITAGTMRIQRYWDYPQIDGKAAGDPNALIDEFESLLIDAVRIRLRADVPVGIALSGGLDSSAILAASCRQSGIHPVCLTSTYGGGDNGELEWARKAAAPFGIAPMAIQAPFEHAEETYRKVAWHMDSPTYSPAVYPLYNLMRGVRAHGIRVMLEGQGADELLGGYVQHAAAKSIQNARQLTRIPELTASLRRLARTFGSRRLMMYVARSLVPATTGPYRQRYGAASLLLDRYAFDDGSDRRRTRGSDDSMNRLLLTEHSASVLPALLHYGDAVSMAHGVESRLPFMDYRLVEFALPLSSSVKMRGGETKWPLREFLRRNRSGVIADRSDKTGYLTPVARWMKDRDCAVLRDTLLKPGARIHEWVSRDRLGQYIDRYAGGFAGAENHLFRLLSTEWWLEECIGKAGS